jgi:hypothetical protein
VTVQWPKPAKKLDSGDKHLLRLIAKDANPEGWATVSNWVLPLVVAMPPELRDLERIGDHGRVRLTPLGQALVDAMGYL